MRRAKAKGRGKGRAGNDDDMPGQDSFLDIVANMVGILILLVMVVGVRAARQVPNYDQAASTQEPAVSEEEVRDAVKSVVDVHQQTVQLVSNVREAKEEVALQDAVRVEVATYVTEIEQQLAEERSKLEVDQQRDYDLRVKLNEAQNKLADLTRKQVALVSAAPEVQQIESLPTPLAETVTGDELHLRLDKGQVSIIPMEALAKEFRADAERNLWRLSDRNAFTGTVGPLGGYRLRYILAKKQFVSQGRSTTVVQSSRWTILPDSPLAEPVERAVQEGSALRSALSGFSPRRTTVTIWTYPDSFDEFRQLKKSLYEWGYATAGRPLPEGIPIGASPNGTKSSAQ